MISQSKDDENWKAESFTSTWELASYSYLEQKENAPKKGKVKACIFKDKVNFFESDAYLKCLCLMRNTVYYTFYGYR